MNQNGRKSLGFNALLGALTALVFTADMLMPAGIMIWICYVVPLLLSYRSSRPLVVPVLGFIMLVLFGLGHLRDIATAAPAELNYLLINRLIGVSGLGLLTLTGFYYARNHILVRRSAAFMQTRLLVSTAIQGEVDPVMLCSRALNALAERLGARAGTAYIRKGNRFVLAAQYGIAPDCTPTAGFDLGEGHLGRCAEALRPAVITGLSDATLTFGTSLSRGRTGAVLLAPARDSGMANAMFEFGFDDATDADPETMERLADVLGIAVRSALYRDRLHELLEETREQAEELRQNAERLASANQELEEQTRALTDSQQMLERQQSELEQQNTRLENQTSELEQQRDALARSQRDLEARTRDLATESRYKSEFVANMSHELRTPLNALLIMARLLAENRQTNLNPEQVKWARTIESSGQDLLVLINDILDLAKIESGRLDLAPEEVAPAQVAQKLVRAFAALAGDKSLDLRADLPDALPVLITDRARLEQVLRNFISNALKFTQSGEVVISMAPARAGPCAGGVDITVRDTGIGIADTEHEKVFEAFRQADGTISRRYGGTGLGLSISRELAGLLGGHISLQSRPGEGSAFTLHLPPAMPDQGAAEPGAAPPPRPAAAMLPPTMPSPPDEPPGHLPGLGDDRDRLDPDARLILVIEDDVAFAQILLDLAHELGFQAILTGTAEDGLKAARRFLPHAIVLDVGLPDHSGLSVLDRLKRDTRTRHIPVHMVSGEDMTREALAQGALSYMVKPVAREELVTALERLEDRMDHQMRRLLIVEDDPVQMEGLRQLLGTRDVQTTGAGTAAEAISLLGQENFDCVVLDLSLPDASGFDVLAALGAQSDGTFPPVIIYTARALSSDEELRLRRHSKSIIIKGAKSPERLIDEVTLFLHQVVSDLPERQQEMLTASLNRDSMLEGRRILVVEDDIRNVYALTSVFEPHGAEVQIARNGREALEALGRIVDSAAPRVDLVLMDVMMPEMDGITATREIRKIERWKNLPIIMLTAKAMAGDQASCLAAGANDYLPKPLDVDKLLSLTRVWMPR